MTQADFTATRSGLAAAPLIGALFRLGGLSIDAKILLVLALALVLWGLAIATWGVVALAMVPLALVPVIYFTLILITVGK